MKRIITISIIALAVGTGAAVSAKAGQDCGDCPMHKKQANKEPAQKMCGGMTCPEKLEGAVTASRNIKDGVEMTITAKKPVTVAQIQELAMVHYSPKAEKCPGCPTTVPGAKTTVENTADGIKVRITSEAPETAKKIQAASAQEHKSAELGKKEPVKKAKISKKYTCAMKCVVSDKPGKCPKCGMPMTEIE
jgi:TusA-related sulfurtransferase